MTLTAAAIIAEVPLGAIVRWSDGSPRPPARHVRKGRDWARRNGEGRLVERQLGSGRGMPDGFTIHEGDFGEGDVIVLRVRRIFDTNTTHGFEIVSARRWSSPPSLAATSFSMSRHRARRPSAGRRTTATAMPGSTSSRYSPLSPPDRPRDDSPHPYRWCFQLLPVSVRCARPGGGAGRRRAGGRIVARSRGDLARLYQRPFAPSSTLKRSSESPDRLADQIENVLFHADEDADSDSPETQRDRFRRDARATAIALLHGEDAADLDRISSAFRDEVSWLIPAGRTVTIVAGPAGLSVEWATDRPAA